MNIDNLNKSMSALLEKMHDVVRLGDVAQITSGYYSMNSSIFTLKDCPYRKGCFIEGYSETLRQYVTVESDAVRPILTPSMVKAFDFADYQHYTKCLITANHKLPDFALRYPYAARYLQNCMEYTMDGTILWRDALINPSLREAMDKKKVIISTLGNVSHAMLDAESHVISTVSTYLCSFSNEDFQTYKAYMAILNSKIFSYMLFHELSERTEGKTRMGALENVFIPKQVEGFRILENIADCLLSLSDPSMPQLTDRISNDRIGYYLIKAIDMVVYEMYMPEYMREKGLKVMAYMDKAPFMLREYDLEKRILDTYMWFQSADNVVRQKIWLLDTRSPELLYRIQTFNPNEQD